MTPDHVFEHIVCADEAIKRFAIQDPARIFNCNETGIALSSNCCQPLSKGLGRSKKPIYQMEDSGKGGLNHVTLMYVVSASGMEYKPVIIFPGKQARYRTVNGNVEIMHNCPPPCYLHRRDPARMISEIFDDWTIQFLAKTKDLIRGGNRLLLIYDGSRSHIRFNILILFQKSGVVLIGLLTYTSHVLQPFEVSVFSSFKSMLQRELHRANWEKNMLDCFDVDNETSTYYSGLFTSCNIQDGFIKTDLWNLSKRKASMDALRKFFTFSTISEMPSVWFWM